MSILVLTSDTLIGTPATGNLEYNGQFYGTDSNASRAQMQRIVLGTVNSGGTNPFPSSSGPTSVTFGSLPSWIKRITVMLNGVSTSGSSQLLIQIGSGSITSSGYVSNAWSNNTSVATSATGFILAGLNSATGVYSGHAILTKLSSTVVVQSSTIGSSVSNNAHLSGGSVTIGGDLDRVVITTVGGADTFDAGSVNILYEG